MAVSVEFIACFVACGCAAVMIMRGLRSGLYSERMKKRSFKFKVKVCLVCGSLCGCGCGCDCACVGVGVTARVPCACEEFWCRLSA